MHVSPGTDALDVYVNGVLLAQGIRYSQTQDYLQTDDGTAIVEVKLAGKVKNIYETTASFTKGEKYTIFVTGLPSVLETLVTTDSVQRADVGYLKIRLVQASQSAGRLDVYITGSHRSLDNEDPDLRNINYGQVTDYRQYEEGNNEFRLRATGPGSKSDFIDTGLIYLDERRIYSVVVLESESGGAPYSFRILEDR